MAQKFVGVDSARGFGIVSMLIIHCFLQQVAQHDNSLFYPIISTLPLIYLILLAPIAILAVMGPFFTLLTVFLSTMKLISLYESNPSKISGFFKKRILTGFLIIIISRSLNYLFNAHFFVDGLLYLPPYQLYMKAETLDSIVWCNILVPAILVFIFKIQKKPNIKLLPNIIILLVLLILTYAFSSFTIQVGTIFIDWGLDNNLGLFAWITSKFVLGRFKLVHTLANGYTGAILGICIIKKVPFKKIVLYSGGFALVSIILFIITSLLSPTNIENFANEDVPVFVQLLSLGLQIFILLGFLYHDDFTQDRHIYTHRKRTRWLRRYGLGSLTAWTFGTTFANGVFKILKHFWGDSINKTGEIHTFHWTVLQIIIFICIVMAGWEFFYRLNERIDYKFTVEQILGFISARFYKHPFRGLKVHKRLLGEIESEDNVLEITTPIIK